MKIYLLAFLTSTLLSLILGVITVAVLKKIKTYQPILKYVTLHKQKAKTPTMGGIFIVLSAVISCFIFSGNGKLTITAIAVTLAFFLVGFIDDFIKIKYENNQGLTATQKIIFQSLIALIVCVFTYFTDIGSVYLPFTLKLQNLGFFSVIFNFFIFLATVNSVNLTDGLDGLCSSVSIVYFIAIAVLIGVELTLNKNYYVKAYEYKGLIIYSVCFVGSLIGYLAFNTSKASIFMGDCGSLALGGAIASISIFSSNSLYIAVLGVTFVWSAITVILQVFYFKKTGKRLFKMAPFHHHLQHLGHSEAKISYWYALVTLIISAVTIISVCR